MKLFLNTLWWIGVLAGVVVAILGIFWERARRRELKAFAKRIGFTFRWFYWGRTPVILRQIKSFTKVSAVRNILHGVYHGRGLTVFEACPAGKSSTRQSVCMCALRVRFPNLQFRAYDFLEVDLIGPLRSDDRHDIEFESEEFNRAFHVSGDDRRFAFDVCHAQMMEWLLENRSWEIAFVNGYLALRSGRQWSPDEILKAFDFAVEFLERIPGFVWENYEPNPVPGPLRTDVS